MAKHEFLSDEWIAAAQAIREEYAGKATTAPPPMRMNVVITEVPFGEESLDAHIDTTEGELSLDMGHLETSDLTVTVDYLTAKAIFVDQDQQAVMQAFMAGKIKVQGDMTKMMAMQATAPDATQVEAASRIAEITA
ncbi:MAG TPA: SCP2 sterol-binding domain-containing protein [Acidimicrobiales bacterium]|nr:SCP2 sterol-binding domain-containing protein [Acidimicrobiales bacterium]